jgi:hypothetical protein
MCKIEELSTNQDPWKAFFILSKIAKQMKNLLKKNKEGRYPAPKGIKL